MAGDIKRVLAIDLGASSGRGIVFESDGIDVNYYEVHRFDNNCVDIDGSLRWDFDRLMHEILHAIRVCKDRDIRLDGIGIDTWGVDYGIIDKNGKLKASPYCYRDSRTKGAIDDESLFGKRELYDIAGISLNEFNTSYQLIAEAKAKGIDSGDTILYMPHLIAYMLTGKFSSDISMASTSAIYNDGYNKNFLDKIGVSPSVFPTPLEVGKVIGNVRRDILDDMGIDYDIKVFVTMGHDTASAVMTVMQDGTEPLYLSSGTWSLFGTIADSPIINDVTYNENYTNERGFGDKVTLLKNIMGMWIIQECRREWNKTHDYSWQDIQDLSKTAKPFNGYINVGDSLFNAPHGMDQRIKDYVLSHENIRLDTVGEIARCVYTSLALEYRYALDGLKKITNKSYDTLYIIGGGTNNDTLNSFVADSLNIKVIGGCTEATAIGNAMAVFLGLGVVHNIDDIHALTEKCYVKKTFTPSPDRSAWDKAYIDYLKLKK